MKTIIVPIDFSDASTNALSFAAELSKRVAAHLIVVNILGEAEDETKTKNKLNDTTEATTLSTKRALYIRPARSDLICSTKYMQNSCLLLVCATLNVRNGAGVVASLKFDPMQYTKYATRIGSPAPRTGACSRMAVLRNTAASFQVSHPRG